MWKVVKILALLVLWVVASFLFVTVENAGYGGFALVFAAASVACMIAIVVVALSRGGRRRGAESM